MKFSVGDRVLLKRTGEEGHIVRFISRDIVEVEVGGVQFPAYTEEIDHPYLKWFTEGKKERKKVLPEQLPVEKEATRPQRLARGVYLSYMPVYRPDVMDDIVDQVKVHLINETPAAIAYDYNAKSTEGRSLFYLRGTLYPFANLYLHHLSLEEMNEQPRFHWAVAPVERGLTDTAQDGLLRIRPSRLFEHIRQLLERNEPTFSYLLTEDPAMEKKIEKIEAPEGRYTGKSTFKRPAWWQPRLELDLHIDKLAPDAQDNMTPAEIMQLQLDTLRYHLEMALSHRQERMIIIHGVGKGVLREAVHKMLGETKGVDRFTREWLGLYGYGATEVFFKR